MSERNVKLTLKAQVADYIAGVEKAAKNTRELGSDVEKLAQKKEAFELLGKTALAVGTAVAVGVGLAVAKFAEFDQAMSNVQAATHATAADQKRLGDAAIEAGASTVFSATESANAIEELSKAGLSTADVLGGALAGSLDLASAGQLGVARAAEIASTTLQQFKLDGAEAGHVADVLAAGAGKAMGSVDDLANGLKFVGPVANAMGISLEQTTGVLALFAQQGIIGEQAGTSLRGVLSSLTSPSSLARTEIEKLGITLYDANGKFLGLENAAGELSKAYGTMDDATRDASMGIIFGRETITAATTLYQAGAKGVDKWTKAVDDSGFAAETARARLDNLKGDIEQLGGAFDTALIQTGSAGNDALRVMAQALTNLVDLYNSAPEPVKAVALATGGLAAAASLAGAAFFLGAPKAAQFNAAIATMGPNAQKASAALTASAGPVGLAFAAAGLAIAIFAGHQAEAKARTDAFSDTLDKQTGKLTEATRELAVSNLAAEKSFLWMSRGSAYDAAEKLGINLDDVTDAALGNAEAFARVKAAYVAIKEPTVEQADAGKILLDTIKEQNGSLTDSVRVILQKRKADREASEAAEVHTAALDTLKGKSDETKDSISELADQIRGFGSATLSTRDAARGLEEAYDALEASVKENGKTLDITEEKGRANEAALDAIAKATLQSAAADYEKSGSQESANAIIAAGREELKKQLEQFGITGEAADAYVDQLGLIPANIDTAVALHAAEAQAALDKFLTDLNNIPGQRDVVINQVIKETGAPRGEVGAAYPGRADGGAIPGSGGPREDNILIRASVGEHMLDAEDVKRMGGQSAVYKFRQSLYAGAPRYRDGGEIQYMRSSGHALAPSISSAPGHSTTWQVTTVGVDPAEVAAELDAKQNYRMRSLV